MTADDQPNHDPITWKAHSGHHHAANQILNDHPFGEFVATDKKPWLGGVQYKFQFPNGFGASVIKNEMSYGGDAALWELAVLGRDGHLTYDTPITDNVIGHLEPFDVGKLLDRIARLGGAAE